MLRYNPDCPTCRKLLSPVQIEQTRSGGEWRIIVEGRTLAHARRKPDAEQLAKLLRIGYEQRPRARRRGAGE